MNYPIIISKQPRSDYGVVVPDLPGCISAGRTLDEAMHMAHEAIELHLEGLIEQGQVPPLPRPAPLAASGTPCGIRLAASGMPRRPRRTCPP
jgi:predicted RNase H-like HicB family nuclease